MRRYIKQTLKFNIILKPNHFFMKLLLKALTSVHVGELIILYLNPDIKNGSL